jgi:hypothetical protein
LPDNQRSRPVLGDESCEAIEVPLPARALEHQERACQQAKLVADRDADTPFAGV